MRLIILSVAILATVLGACDDATREGVRSEQEDGGADGGDGANTGPSDDTDADVPIRCEDDRDCDDGLVCNGEERCVDEVCRDGEPKSCSMLHPCDEEQGGCDCRVPSADGDYYPAPECPIAGRKPDCDDNNAGIHPGATEICDGLGVNEDCDPATIHNPTPGDLGHGDDDGDGFVGRDCFNLDARFIALTGDDCDDGNPLINGDATEECDYIDNDCDGDVDEDEDGSPSDTLRVELYPDVDGDGFPARGEPVLACEGRYQPAGLARSSEADDCDDGDPKINVSALELCDGEDNDCDRLVDADDDELIEQYDFDMTVVRCRDGRWQIDECPVDRLWCTDVVQYGCATDATSIDNCRECGNRCAFACGLADCDEITSLANGLQYSCGLTVEGNVACWGWGDDGRLGSDSERSSSTPRPVVDLSHAHLLDAGPHNACAAIGDHRELHCWGRNEDGVLGNDDHDDRPFAAFPDRVVGAFGEPVLEDVVSVGVGEGHACAADVRGNAFCWGNAAYGRLANGLAEDEIVLPRQIYRTGRVPVENAARVVSGERHSCLINDDHVVECWGDNTFGQLGDPAYLDSLSTFVRAVPGLTDVTGIDTGWRHTCAIRDGGVLCWGANGRKQLGRESTDENSTPLPVVGLSDVIALAIGSTFSCALDDAGAVWCWGSNDLGERGDEDPDDRAEAARLPIEHVVALAAGDFHVCAVTEDAQTYCWGDNYSGQLGVGMTSAEPIVEPQAILPLQRIRR